MSVRARLKNRVDLWVAGGGRMFGHFFLFQLHCNRLTLFVVPSSFDVSSLRSEQFGFASGDVQRLTFDFRLFFDFRRSTFFPIFTAQTYSTMSDTVLQLKNATIFQDNRTILSNVSLEVNQGEFIYIIGKTGAGKSSLMKTLYADLPLHEGQGNIVGFDLTKLKESQIPFLRRKIGIIFQDFKLLPDRSVYDNMLFVLKATGWTDKTRMDEKIDEVLTKVDLQTFARKMPHQLSGGEQQRVAIARALLNDPELILADEPTGNLDPQTSVEIMELMRKINANGKTIIMATHDYAIIMKFPSKTLKVEKATLFEVVQRTV